MWSRPRGQASWSGLARPTRRPPALGPGVFAHSVRAKVRSIRAAALPPSLTSFGELVIFTTSVTDRALGYRPRRRRGRRLAGALAVVLVVVVVLAGVQLIRPLPKATATPTVPTAFPAPGPVTALPWPTAGQATVEVQGLGSLGSLGGENPVPIASLAKTMTAYVVLADHPLGPTDAGPSLTMTPEDAAAHDTGLAERQSVLKVTPGELLSERQALEALLVPSANNIADALARWDAGSIPAFVTKMNDTAARLGMKHTRYTDASGFDPATVSTAVDQTLLAKTAMASPNFAAIVAKPQVTLPVAGTVFNYNALVGHDGVIGVKTGSTAQAGGCLVFAARRDVNGVPQTVIGTVLGQAGAAPITTALTTSKALIDAAFAALRSVTVLPEGAEAAQVQVPWGGTVPAVATQPVQFVGWAGMPIRTNVTTQPLSGGARAGSPAGVLHVTAGERKLEVPLRLDGDIADPPLSWRMRRL